MTETVPSSSQEPLITGVQTQRMDQAICPEQRQPYTRVTRNRCVVDVGIQTDQIERVQEVVMTVEREDTPTSTPTPGPRNHNPNQGNRQTSLVWTEVHHAQDFQQDMLEEKNPWILRKANGFVGLHTRSPQFQLQNSLIRTANW